MRETHGDNNTTQLSQKNRPNFKDDQIGQMPFMRLGIEKTAKALLFK